MSANVPDEIISRLQDDIEDLKEGISQLEASVQGKPGDRESIRKSLWATVDDLAKAVHTMSSEREAGRKTITQLVTGAIATVVTLLLGYIFARVTGSG